MVFYGNAKKQNPNTADKNKDSTFAFYDNCNQQKITPNPIASKIHENYLSLLSYPISKEMAEVLG